jgi:hypothetical protein
VVVPIEDIDLPIVAFVSIFDHDLSPVQIRIAAQADQSCKLLEPINPASNVVRLLVGDYLADKVVEFLLRHSGPHL